MVEKGRRLAAQVLEAAEADVEFEPRGAGGGRFSIAGTDRGIGIMELATRLRDGTALPPGTADEGLDVQTIHESAPSAYPNGCHVCEVELDPDTGVIEVVGYWMVNDFGVVINPMLVSGQAHGGVAQGIGQALMERTAYDEGGQFVTGSYMDYQLPRAHEMPELRLGQPSGAGGDQRPGRQGLRRGGLCRLVAVGDERGGGRDGRVRGAAHGHARDVPARLGGDSPRRVRTGSVPRENTGAGGSRC